MATSTDPSTYKLNHSMLRVKDPKVSVKYYQDNFGMKLLHKAENKDAKFDLYFLAFDSPSSASAGSARSDREGILELTHNYGSEDKEGQVYHNGNSGDKKGFGHICFSVDNLSGACAKLESDGVKFQKKQKDGRQQDIAFALDPDNYWIELIGHGKDDAAAKFNLDSYRFNHTMIRVKDPEASIKFYRDVLGMKLLRKAENKEAEFDLYFLGFSKELPAGQQQVTTAKTAINPLPDVEGLLELTHNYGTEKQEGQVYHNGNDEPQGFGHIAVTCDNVEAACASFDQHGVKWKKRLTDGRMRHIAFVLDPDNYWVELVPNETYAKK